MKIGYEKHVFICTNRRPAGDARGSCGDCGGESIRDYFKSGVKRLGLSGRVRANASGCLDYCAHGTVVVVYPEATWYQVRSEADAEEILQSHLLQGKVVDHLLLAHKVTHD